MTTPTSGGSRRTPRTSRSASADPFVLTLWTADLAIAAAADAAGVHRIGVDLEHLGKAERQVGHSTWLSPHSLHDVRAVSRVLDRALSFVRINPLHAGTRHEIESVLASGAAVVMAPMVASAAQAADFTGLVGRRARTIALIETRAGIDSLPAIASVADLDEVHIGLNDLALSLARPSRWSLLAGDLVKDAAACVHAAGLPFGFGGIGCACDHTLPIPSDLIYAEYARTGATRALLARSFDLSATTLRANVAASLTRLAEWRAAAPEALDAAHAELGRCVQLSGRW
jgi:2-keto-3-deoxy-L-rhamnonate aldolase RhmA